MASGVRIGDSELDVVWTRFSHNRSYGSISFPPSAISGMQGGHTIGLMLGEGFCGESAGKASKNATRAGLLRVAFHTADEKPGEVPLLTVVTDSTWQVSGGPIIWDSNYYGESYDARLEQEGWNAPGFRPGAAWSAATVIHYPRAPFMSSQLMPPIRAVRELKPIAIIPVNNNDGGVGATATSIPSWTFDFGQEFAGWCTLALPGNTPRGVNITLAYTEVLAHPPLVGPETPSGPPVPASYDGTAFYGNLFWSYPVDHYVTKGPDPHVPGQQEHYSPSFTQHGFRYVQLTADPPLDADPTDAMLTGINLRSDVREQSHLAIAHPLLQRLSNNSWWTEAAALMGVPQGATGRGERGAWTGDSAFASESEAFDFDTAAFFGQYLLQHRDLICNDGTVGNVVPATDPRRDGPLEQTNPNCSGIEGDPSWGTAYPTIAWNLWRYYHVPGVLQTHYAKLTLYMGMLEAQYTQSGLKTFFCKYGDWNPVVKTSCHITAAASFLHDLIHMADIAAAAGDAAAAAKYRARLQELKPEWHAAFWDPINKVYGTGTQTAQALPLWLGIVPDDLVSGVVSNLVDSLAQHGYNGGFIGVSGIDAMGAP